MSARRWLLAAAAVLVAGLAATGLLGPVVRFLAAAAQLAVGIVALVAVLLVVGLADEILHGRRR